MTPRATAEMALGATGAAGDAGAGDGATGHERAGDGATGHERAGAGDGRLARGERTRRALADALIALLEEGDPRPTARRIAERAGVSVRLVFHHFEDLESILRAAVAIQEHRHWSRIQAVDATLPLGLRMNRIVRQRCDVYQAVAPVRRAAELLVDSSPTVAGEMARARDTLRRQLRSTFAPEFARQSPRRAERLLDALDVATSWETWEQLQRLGRSAAACRHTIGDLVGALLGQATAGGGAP